ncbi:MAG: ABC transporter ATP-binding protein [Mycoplasma sp.]
MYKNFLRVIKETEKSNRQRMFWTIILITLSVLSHVVMIFLLSDVLNLISNYKSNESLNKIVISLSIIFLLALISFVTHFYSTRLTVRTCIDIGCELRMKMFNKTQNLSPQDLQSLSSYSIISRVTSDPIDVVYFFKIYINLGLRGILYFFLGIISTIIQVALFKGSSLIWLSMIPIFFFLCYFVFVVYVSKKYYSNKLKSKENSDKNISLIEENIKGYQIIKIFSLKNIVNKVFNNNNKKLQKHLIKADLEIKKVGSYAGFIIDFYSMTFIVFAGLYAWFAPTSETEIVSSLIGIIFSLISFVTFFSIGLNDLSLVLTLGISTNMNLKRMYEVFDIKPSITNCDKPLTFNSPSLSFKNVDFKIKNKKILKNINFDIKNGETLGIIGQSGSGKTTVANLIARLYDVSKGEILIDNINIKNIDLDFLKSNLSYCIQDKVLISGTIRENLIFDKNIDDETIKKALTQAQAIDFVNKKENGLDFVLTQQGNNLSGGQKQRLSIARTFLNDSQILLFDDSTSALDNITEQKLLDVLNSNDFKNKTKVIISQKIKSIIDCDKIIVLDQGKIIQQGTHKELLKDINNIYYKIWVSQNLEVLEC